MGKYKENLPNFSPESVPVLNEILRSLWSAIKNITSNAIINHSELSELDYASAEHTGFQPTLVSGTNIKTINGASILSAGNLTLLDAEVDTLQTVTVRGPTTDQACDFNAGMAVASGQAIGLEGTGGNTKWVYNSSSEYLEGWVDGVKRVEL